jgi:mannosyltransferase OCH1-like enzyme
MIPKVIHYCWFGRGEMPDLALKCIASWKKYLPTYEIKLWNEDNFDFESYKYAADAYKERKFAFVSDVCRLYVL